MTLKQVLTLGVKTDEDSIRLVKKYLKRELVRPKTTWAVLIIIGALMLVLPFCIGYILVRIFSFFSPLWCYFICYLSIDLLLLRLLLIKLVRCYQHYASEDLRRFCMCMPSCSEYAIAVLKKYPILIAIIKIVIRLVVICDGEMKIHNP